MPASSSIPKATPANPRAYSGACSWVSAATDTSIRPVAKCTGRTKKVGWST
ncbi:hypothetical protein [Curtobacterium sp. 24E2]|nr:hypothetical protein JN350_12305 [Curtobacterium sp. 24E2]